MNVPSTLGEFFTFIGSAGAIGFVLSLVAENWQFFQTRNQQGKIAILGFIALLMGLGSYSLVRFVPAGVVEQAQPIYQVIVATLSILIASQVWHKTVNQQTIDVTAKLISPTPDATASVTTAMASGINTATISQWQSPSGLSGSTIAIPPAPRPTLPPEQQAMHG